MASKAFSLREAASPDDLAALLPLLREAIESQHGGPPPVVEARLDAARGCLLGSIREKETLVLVADRPGRPEVSAGILAAARASNPFLGSSLPFVYLLYVRPADRRRGIAAALLARAESVLHGRGFRSVGAEVPYQDDAQISLGERRGWVREREWMVKEL